MESVNTPDELDAAVEAICRERGIKRNKSLVYKHNRYQQLQARKRKIEEDAIERGEIDSEGNIFIHGVGKQASPESIKAAKEAAKKTTFNNHRVKI